MKPIRVQQKGGVTARSILLFTRAFCFCSMSKRKADDGLAGLFGAYASDEDDDSAGKSTDPKLLCTPHPKVVYLCVSSFHNGLVHTELLEWLEPLFGHNLHMAYLHAEIVDNTGNAGVVLLGYDEVEKEQEAAGNQTDEAPEQLAASGVLLEERNSPHAGYTTAQQSTEASEQALTRADSELLPPELRGAPEGDCQAVQVRLPFQVFYLHQGFTYTKEPVAQLFWLRFVQEMPAPFLKQCTIHAGCGCVTGKGEQVLENTTRTQPVHK